MLYNNYQMAVFMLVICILGKTTSVLFYGLGFLASRRSSIPGIIEEGNEANVPKTSEIKA